MTTHAVNSKETRIRTYDTHLIKQMGYNQCVTYNIII